MCLLSTGILVSGGSGLSTVRTSTWSVQRRWTSWTSCCAMTTRRGSRPARPWITRTSVSPHLFVVYKNEIKINDKISNLFISVVPAVPIVKDQSRVAGSANLPSGNAAVSSANMITGENTHMFRIISCLLMLNTRRKPCT